jgi:S-adenosylmethionine decarboxylase
LKSENRCSLHMSGSTSRGGHVVLDYTDYSPPVDDDGEWMLQVLRDCVRKAGIREVHSHVAQFDGSESPPGFAAIVLIDESHVSAHCYSESGLLAIDIFTCGDSDPGPLADKIHSVVVDAVPGLVLSGRGRLDRF